MGNPIGVINEQGYPAGKFGFEQLNEQDQEKIKPKSEDDK